MKGNIGFQKISYFIRNQDTFERIHVIETIKVIYIQYAIDFIKGCVKGELN